MIASRDGNSVRVWNSTTGKPLTVLDHYGYNVHTAAWSPNGAMIATRTANTDSIWDAATGEPVAWIG